MVKFLNVNVPALAIIHPVEVIVIVPADGAKVPVTVKRPPTVAELDVPEIVVLIFRLP